MADFDFKAIIEKAVDKAKNDPDFVKKFQKDPEKTIESVAGVNIPDGYLDKIIAGVKGKISLDAVGGILGKLSK